MSEEKRKIDSKLSGVDIVYEALIGKVLGIQELLSIIKEVKGYSEEDFLKRKANIYLDLISSGKFVALGEDTWGLKVEHLDKWKADDIRVDKKDLDIPEELLLDGEPVLLPVEDYYADDSIKVAEDGSVIFKTGVATSEISEEEIVEEEEEIYSDDIEDFDKDDIDVFNGEETEDEEDEDEYDEYDKLYDDK
ncbi:MAG: DNA-directed RNA polymerase subunit delta [Acholeplasmatales bacterium]|jgi:DNA-directed RNA polymerase subunit delta|nr:DNA-directed RNA polymerase subunit delta [Acholeplasmatales bacterium]